MNNNKPERMSTANHPFKTFEKDTQMIHRSGVGNPYEDLLPQSPQFHNSRTLAGDINLILNPQAIRWDYPNKEPRLLIGSLNYRRPSPAQQWEIDREAVGDLEALGKRTVEGWKGAPGAENLVFDHVELVEIKNQHTETNKNESTGVRHWEATGTPIGHLYYRVIK